MKPCLYMLGGINYKNGYITTCPRQSDKLVLKKETFLPSEIFNHNRFKWAREKLYNDEFPTGCYTCEAMENINHPSMRQDFLLNKDNNFHRIERIPSNPNETGLMKCYDSKTHQTSFEGLRHVELRFSNACNFACLHCSDVFSSGWTTKLKNYIPDHEDRFYKLKQILKTDHRNGPNDKDQIDISLEESMTICEDLIENFPNLRWVDFAGGELLFQKQFYPTLKKLADHPNAKNMNISFHTNFNAKKFNVEELSSLLEPFSESTITISVDAGKSFYSYFRHGGDWDQLEKNIRDFKKINNFTYVQTSCTTSIYQMLDIYDIFHSFLHLKCNFEASIVQSPSYLDPALIFVEFEKETINDLRRTEDLISNSNVKGVKVWFEYIKNYVYSKKPSQRDYFRWLIYRKKSDIIWKQNFNDYFNNYQIDEHNELVRV